MMVLIRCISSVTVPYATGVGASVPIDGVGTAVGAADGIATETGAADGIVTEMGEATCS